MTLVRASKAMNLHRNDMRKNLPSFSSPRMERKIKALIEQLAAKLAHLQQ